MQAFVDSYDTPTSRELSTAAANAVTAGQAVAAAAKRTRPNGTRGSCGSGPLAQSLCGKT